MNEMKVSAVPMTGVVQHSTKAQNPQPGAGEDVSQEQTVGAVAKRGEDEINNLKEMLQQAKEKAEERRDSLKLKQNSAQYGDAAMMAYARLARARNQGQVNAAASYAQRQIVRFQSALRSDSENAERIKAAIRQLQKAVGRAGKKKRELQKEDIIKARQCKAKLEKQKRKSASLQQELTRRNSKPRWPPPGWSCGPRARRWRSSSARLWNRYPRNMQRKLGWWRLPLPVG